jgi:hypothetical protein
MSRPRKKALLIGINYRGQAAELAGCVNDIADVRAVCATLKYDEVCVLYDGIWPGAFNMADNRLADIRPTRANITAAFRWLVAGAGRGDKLYLHYSGHGGQMPARVAGGESDGCDETLVPIDYETAGMMRDDEIRALLVEPLRGTGASLRGALDCCHSGTGMDLKYNLGLAEDLKYNLGPAKDVTGGRRAAGEPAGEPAWAAQTDIQTDVQTVVARLTANAVRAELIRWFGSEAVAGFLSETDPISVAPISNSLISDTMFVERVDDSLPTMFTATTIEARSTRAAGTPDVLIVSGCADSQTSADASFNHRANGALTYYILAIFRRAIASGAWPLAANFLVDLRRRLRGGGYDQIPQISSESPVGKTTVFSMA